MVATPFIAHTVLESDETKVVVECGDDGHARLDVTTNGYRRGGAAEAGRLVCEAIHWARLRNADRVDGALDASSPACGAILDALHHRIGIDLESIAMRRAGSSVLVILRMHPPATTCAPGSVLLSVIPSQPSPSTGPREPARRTGSPAAPAS